MRPTSPRRRSAPLSATSSAAPMSSPSILRARNERVYATGIRNCSGLAIEPGTGALWCAVNERDGLGDDLPPDYVTHVARKAPSMAGPGIISAIIRIRATKASAPTLRTASRRLTFSFRRIRRRSASPSMRPNQFPSEYTGDAFVTLHGSWNCAKRTGYKVVRLLMKDGKPTGAYEDFLVGFVQPTTRACGAARSGSR